MGTSRRGDKAKAIQLRRRGKSYNDIRRVLGIRSKGTISVWLRAIELSSKARSTLATNSKKAHDRGLMEFNRIRTKRIASENNAARREGRIIVDGISKRELCLVGAALYWGEGTKSASRPANPALSFANCDEEMISLFLRFLRNVIQVPESRIRAGIHLYEGTTDAEAREHWSKVTGLPPDRFYIVRLVSKASRGKRNPRLLPFGTAVIRVNDRKVFHKVCGMIDGLRGLVRSSSAGRC